MIDFRQGDNRAQLRRMIADGEFVHSVVTDPPYGLQSITKRFSKSGRTESTERFAAGPFLRTGKGFMGKLWDGSGIERDPEFWRLVHDVMLPGAYIVAFSSSRTYGYMQIAMEAAGFVTHPMLGWTFASGFPKAHNAARAIDQQLGVKGGKGAVKAGHQDFVGRDNLKALRESGVLSNDGGFSRPWMHDPEAVEANHYTYAPGSPEAQQWDGWAYGGQALKPALEPIYVGQKPFNEKNGALNILKYGVGAMNIDGCRVPCEEGGRPAREVAAMRDDVEYAGNSLAGRVDGSLQSSKAVGSTDIGRHPANLLHDGSDEVIALFPNSKGQQGRSDDSQRSQKHTYGAVTDNGKTYEPRNDDGTAARFFNSFPHEGPLLHYPKAGKKDRAGSKHATVKPIALMRHLVRLVTPPGGIVLDPFAGTGTTGQAALDEGMRCVLMEAEMEYARDIRRRFSLTETVSDKLVNLLEAMG